MEETVVRLARQVAERRYGKFRGFVADNDDPEKRARLKLKVPSVLGDEVSDWALPCLPFGGGAAYGWFAVPEKDAQVWVEFEEGDIHRPVWVGTFWQSGDDVPQDAGVSPPTTRLFMTPAGHKLQFDDKEDEEQITLSHPKDASLVIDKDGVVALTDAKGAKLTLDAANEKIVLEDSNGNTLTMSSSGTTIEDANGNKIEMTASGINVKGQQIVVDGTQVMLGGQGGEPVIKGTSFLTLFATHMHPTAMGPSGPPIPQGEMSSLSTKVMTS
ncbi:MAG: phage baseplate assembly protein V [Sulfurifustaceae bacterium]